MKIQQFQVSEKLQIWVLFQYASEHVQTTRWKRHIAFGCLGGWPAEVSPSPVHTGLVVSPHRPGAAPPKGLSSTQHSFTGDALDFICGAVGFPSASLPGT